MSESWKSSRRALIAAAVVLIVVVGYQVFLGEPPEDSKAAPDLARTFAPLVAIALAIERFWESVFGLFESFVLGTGRALRSLSGATNWMKTELEAAQVAVNQAASALKQDPTDTAALKALQDAEKRLLDGESRLAESLKAPEYLAFKRGVTVMGSLIVGVVVAVSMKLRMLGPAGLAVWWPFDSILTGLAIGAGPGPLHAFIGTLQEMRNAFAGVADLARGAGVARAAEGLKQAAAGAREAVGQPPAFAAGPSPALRREVARVLQPR